MYTGDGSYYEDVETITSLHIIQSDYIGLYMILSITSQNINDVHIWVIRAVVSASLGRDLIFKFCYKEALNNLYP